jgi:signal transduction histidine kinase
MFDGGVTGARRARGLAATRRGSSKWRRSSHDLPEAVSVVAGIIAAALGIAFALHWDAHWTDAGLRASIETTIAVTILLAAALALVESRRRRQLEPLLVLAALVAVGLTNLVSWAPHLVPSAVHVHPGADAGLVVLALVPLMLVVAGVAGGRVEVRKPRRTLLLTCTTCLAAVAVAQGIDALLGRTGATAAGSEAALIVNVAAAAVFVLSAGGLYWRSRPATTGNCLLAGAALLLAAARLQVIVAPVVPGAWVTPRELLRLGAYALLLAAVVADYRWTHRADDRASVAAEREELVRDLHDGLAQDLAAIAMHSEHLDPRGAEDPVLLGHAARRALAATRRTLTDLSAPTAPNTIMSLRRLAHELDARFGTDISVHADADPGGCPALDLDRAAHQRFVSVARDAIIRAADHSEVRQVDVVIRSCGTRWQLTVCSDRAEPGQSGRVARLRRRPWGSGAARWGDRPEQPDLTVAAPDESDLMSTEPLRRAAAQ